MMDFRCILIFNIVHQDFTELRNDPQPVVYKLGTRFQKLLRRIELILQVSHDVSSYSTFLFVQTS